MTTDDPARVDAVLEFWFGRPGDPHHGRQRKAWWKKDPAFDARVERRFRADYADAAAGRRDAWQDDPRACLALIVLLDQFPRNMFRGEARSYATDDLAIAAARRAVARGFDRALAPVERQFVYMPFEHSEDLVDQHRSVELFRALGDANALDFAERHRAIVARFGRFPHRNAILGRASAPAEVEFLTQPGSRF